VASSSYFETNLSKQGFKSGLQNSTFKTGFYAVDSAELIKICVSLITRK